MKGVKGMRKRKLGSLVMIGLSLVVLSSCGISKKEDDGNALKKYCEKYASEYEVIEQKENGAIMVSINAPDFKSVTEAIMAENGENDITVNDIEEIVNEYPDYKKEYKFWVDADEKDEVEKGFLNEISEELIVDAIKNVDYTEEWSAEE